MITNGEQKLVIEIKLAKLKLESIISPQIRDFCIRSDFVQYFVPMLAEVKWLAFLCKVSLRSLED